MKKTILALVLAAAAQGFAMQASAAVLDFESLSSVEDNLNVGLSYVESGFRLDDVGGSSAFGFATWGTSNMFYTGSTALMNNDYDALTQLTAVGGGNFNLNAMDMAVMFPAIQPDGVDVTFTGTRFDNSTVATTFHVADSGVQNFTFSGFTNLTKVTWSANSNVAQFDNINVAAVPEPETYAMFLAGLGLMGFMARRRNGR
jgi:hypothetical protein